MKRKGIEMNKQKSGKNLNKASQSSTSRASDPGDKIPFHRISITIREDQYKTLKEKELSLSALVRDLLDDRFSSNKIVLNLSDQGKKFYDMLISNLGTQDVDLEPLFLQALDEFVGKRINEIQEIRKQMKKQI